MPIVTVINSEMQRASVTAAPAALWQYKCDVEATAGVLCDPSLDRPSERKTSYQVARQRKDKEERPRQRESVRPSSLQQCSSSSSSGRSVSWKLAVAAGLCVSTMQPSATSLSAAILLRRSKHDDKWLGQVLVGRVGAHDGRPIPASSAGMDRSATLWPPHRSTNCPAFRGRVTSHEFDRSCRVHGKWERLQLGHIVPAEGEGNNSWVVKVGS